MTEKLYDEQAYLRTFSSAVVSCEADGKRYAVILQKTAFYPEGGGQAGDTGILGGVRVLDTQIRGEDVVHICEAPLVCGSVVEGSIDWPRRFDLMQQHSGEHIISGLVHRQFGLDNVGFHMGEHVTAIDFNGVLTMEQLKDIERQANEVVWRDVALEITHPSPEALAQLDYRSKKELHGDVRIVTIPGADVCACCGTHVHRTGEIGPIQILSLAKLRAGIRLELVCGLRAYTYTRAILDQNLRVSHLLSSKALHTSEAVEKLQQDLEAQKNRIYQMETRYFNGLAAQQKGQAQVVVFESDLSPNSLRRLCDTLMHTCGVLCAVFCGNDTDGYRYILGEVDGNVQPLTRQMNTALQGRGGGTPDMTQGAVKATRSAIEEFFNSLG